MKKNYVEPPKFEVIEIEIENAVLQTSGIEDFSNGITLGKDDRFYK